MHPTETLNQIVEKLNDRRNTSLDVSNGTGLSVCTVDKIRNGKQRNPAFNSLVVLYDFFNEKKES